MIQIWWVIKAELSAAKLAYGLIFLWSFGMSAVFSLSEGNALRMVVFIGYMTNLALNPCRPQFGRLPVSLPVPMVVFGALRVVAQMAAILLVIAGSGLAVSLFYDDTSTLMRAFHWIFALVIAATSLQWIWFDLANRSYRRFALASYVWLACYMLGSFALILGRLDGLLVLVSAGSNVIGLWVAAGAASILSVLSFSRRRSFVSRKPGARAQRGSRLVRPGRFASLTILLNQMVSNWKAYVLSYAAHGTMVWLFVRKADGLDLDSSVWLAKLAGMIISGMTLGAIIQAITEGAGRKQFQYFLLPVSVSQLAKYRIIRVLPFVMPPLLLWFIAIMRESSWQLYGIHWAFPALVGWICVSEAVVNVMRDRWPRFRFTLGSDEWSHNGMLISFGASLVTWCALAMLSVSAPESIAGGLGRALLWSPGGAGFVLAVGLVVALISVRTFAHSSSRLV